MTGALGVVELPASALRYGGVRMRLALLGSRNLRLLTRRSEVLHFSIHLARVGDQLVGDGLPVLGSSGANDLAEEARQRLGDD